MNLAAGVRRAVECHLPHRKIRCVVDRGRWVRHIFEVHLDGEDVVYLKMSVPQPGWLEGGEAHERDVADLFAGHGLPGVVPTVLAVDTTGEILPHPYVIQAREGGTRLGEAVRTASEEEGAAIYEAVGRLYAQMHAIHHEDDGLWNGSTPDRPWGAPTDYMYQAEVVEGSGRRALESGCVSRGTYGRAVRVWSDHLDYLKTHQPSLVHVSAFPWTIYVAKRGNTWTVAKLTSVGDTMWWDPAYDIATLRYITFGPMKHAWWAGFLRGYGTAFEEKRLLLYAVMQRLCAAMGVYMAPENAEATAWAAHALDDLGVMLDKIEGA